MSHHPAVKDVAVIVGVDNDHQEAGNPVVQAFVSLKNPWDEYGALLRRSRHSPIGFIYKFINFYFCVILILFLLFIDAERVSEEENIRGTNISS